MTLSELNKDKVKMSEKQTCWYVIRVISGKENKIKQYLEIDIQRSGWDKVIKQILIPTEKIYKIKKGKKVTREKNFFPGYMLLEAVDGELTKEMIQTINQTTSVIGFLSDANKKPIPMKPAEVNRILGKVDEMQETEETMNEPFILGETIKITDGPFNDFNGVIEEIFEEKKKLKVMVKIFGRRTPVELNFMQVEKV